MGELYEMLKARRMGGGSSSGGSATLITKSITQNGTYSASDDSADGYSEVSVDVANSYTAQDEGKVVSNGALVSQTSETYTENATYDTTLVNSVTVNVPSGIEACELIKPSGFGGEVYGINTEDRTIVAGLLYNTTGSYSSSIVLTFPQGFTPRYTKGTYVAGVYYDYGYGSPRDISTSTNITNSSITLEIRGNDKSNQTRQIPLCIQFGTN